MTFDPERAFADGKALMGTATDGYKEVKIICIDRPNNAIWAMNVETCESYMYRWDGTIPYRRACLKNICRPGQPLHQPNQGART